MKKNLLLTCLLLVTAFLAYAQESNGVEMATQLRSSGKIYVVVSVLVAIFLGLAFYLFSIDNRLKKIEKLRN